MSEGARRLAVVELEVLFSAERFTAGDGQSVVRRGRGPQPHEGAYILTKNVGTYAPPALMGSQPRRGGLAKPRPTAWERQWFSELSPEGATYGMRAYHAPSGLEVGNELSSYPYHPGRWPGFARPPLRGSRHRQKPPWTFTHQANRHPGRYPRNHTHPSLNELESSSVE